MKNLFAYWVGEFGWELFCWQGILRYMSDKYNKIYVAGRPGHGVIYEDFADYIPLSGIGFETSGCRNKNYTYTKEHLNYDIDEVFPPGTYLTHYYPPGDNTKYINTKQTFIKYGQKIDSEFDVIIHARFSDKWNSSYRNWDLTKWDKLCEYINSKGLNIGAIGITGQAYLPKNAYDLFDLPLKDITNYLKSSLFIIGPSSGPMHLAALCDTKIITWGEPNLQKTYTKEWNPFGVPVQFTEGWNPDINMIEKNVDKMLKFI